MHRAESQLPVLDGVRGLAITLVILRHLSLVDWLQTSPNLADRTVVAIAQAGWVGVDLFFVLSGFLITGILLRERERPVPVAEKAGRFYWRRVLRITPLYYAACALLFFVVPHLPYFREQPELPILHQVQGWYWGYGVNLLEVLRGPSATPFNTGHFWSLAVEEQFYLAWPFLVLGLPLRVLRRLILAFVAVGPCVRWLCLAALAPTAGGTAAYTLSLARVDVLGVGALIAFYYQERGAAWTLTKVMAPRALGVMVMVFAAIAFSRGGAESTDPLVQLVGYSVVALGMGALLVLALSGNEGMALVPRLLGAAPLRTLGKYAYCLYVVHYPFLIILDLVWMRLPMVSIAGSRLPSWGAYGVVLVGCSFAIAWVSWRVLEAPMLAWKDRLPFRA